MCNDLLNFAFSVISIKYLNETKEFDFEDN